MPQPCIIPDCFGSTNRSLFRVAKNINKREKWLKAIREVYPNLNVGKNFSVCENHFRKADFTACIADVSGKIIQEVSMSRKRLRKAAVPHFDMRNLDSDNDSTISFYLKPELVIVKEEISEESHVIEHEVINSDNSSVSIYQDPIYVNKEHLFTNSYSNIKTEKGLHEEIFIKEEVFNEESVLEA